MATRKSTRLSMPRTAGLSGSSRVWFILRKPSDSTVARISGFAPIALFMRVALRVLSGTGRCTTVGARRFRALVGRGQTLADHLLDFLTPQLGDLGSRLQLL